MMSWWERAAWGLVAVLVLALALLVLAGVAAFVVLMWRAVALIPS